MTIRTRALFLLGLAAAVSCSDAGNPLAPEVPEPQPVPPASLVALDCTVTIAGGSMRCELPQPNTGAAHGSGELIVGGQNVYVRLAASAFSTYADTIQMDVTVENLIPQALGTTDGVTVDPAGVRVFFYEGPVSNNPSAGASVGNPDGEAFFTSAEQPYFQWNEMLAQNDTSAPRTWKLRFTPGSTSVSFRVYVSAQVQYEAGWIDVTPAADTLLPEDTLQLSAVAYDVVGRTGTVSQTFTWSRGGDGVTTVDEATGQVVASTTTGVDTIYAMNGEQAVGRAVIVVNTPLVVSDVTYPALGNVTLPVPAGFGLAGFVSDPDGDDVTIVPATDAATTGGGLLTVGADGSFSYLPPAGFTGTDTYTYSATDGTVIGSATLSLEVATRYWYAQADSSGSGTQASPSTLKAAETASAIGETIFVLDGGGSTAGVDEGIVLKDGQSLIGQGVSEAVTARLPMPTDVADSLTVTLLAAGDAPGITRTTAGATVQLGSGNTIRGLGISSTAGAGIAGTGFGTLTTGDAVAVEATGGPALLLETGELAGSFAQVGSSGSTGSGLSLTGVTGALAPTGGNITNPAGAAILVSGGSVDLTWAGNVTQPNAAALVDVNGGHDGTIEFNTGTISATAGTGLQFNGVAGTYTFAGTTTLNGGDAGVDITNGSDGTFSFGTGTAITDPSGTAFYVYGSSPAVTYSGSISQGNAAALVEVGEQPGGSVTFQTGTLAATAGSGIGLSNADGTVAFNGTTTLSGGATIAVVGGSAGTISFASGASVANPSGTGLLVVASAPSLTYAGSITTTGTGRPVMIDGMTGGSVAVSGAVSSTGLGILVQNSTGGGTTFSGTKTLSTGANNAVALTGNSGHVAAFTGGGLALTTTTGSAFAATGGGTVTVTGTGNEITTGTGTALNLSGVALGASGMTFATLNTGAAATPVVLTNVTGGSEIAVGGGAIPSGAGTRIAVSGGAFDLAWAGSVAQATAAQRLLAVTGGHTGTVEFTGALSGTSGTGLGFDNADGSYSFTGTVTLAGGDAGVDVLNNSGGTFAFGIGTSITNPTGIALDVSNSSPTLTFAGPITHNSGRAVSLSSVGGTVTVSGNISGSGPAATGILVQNSSANVTFSGSSKTLSTQGNAAVTLSNNSGSVLFSGGNLGITTTTGAGIVASAGGGTLQVTGANNTLSAGSGTALSVQNVNIGASGLSFVSISHSGGANGIVLVNTGSTNGLQVTGSGTNGSGGSIVNTTGGDGATAGNGIYLSAVRNVSLSWMALSGHANNGLYGTGVRGLTMNKMRFTGTHGTSNSGTFDESPVHLVDVGGAVKLTNSRFDGGAYNAVLVENIIGTAPVLDSLVMENDTVESMQGSTADVRGSAILFHLQDGSGDIRIRNNRVTSWWGNGIHSVIQGTASGTSRITGNFVDNQNGALAGAGGIGVAGGSHTYLISGNTVRHTNGTAISADRVNFGTTMQGTIEGNNIGVSGDNNSGTVQGNAIFASHHGPGTTTHRIRNNTIRQAQAASGSGAIWVLTGDASGFGGSGALNATVTGNDIQESGTPSITNHSAILVTVGTQSTPVNDTDQACLDIGGAGAARNNIVNFNPTSIRPNMIRVNARFGTTSRFPGYTGAQLGATSQTDLGSYLLGRNTASTSVNGNTSTGGFLNTVPAGSACPQPTL